MTPTVEELKEKLEKTQAAFRIARDASAKADARYWRTRDATINAREAYEKALAQQKNGEGK